MAGSAKTGPPSNLRAEGSGARGRFILPETTGLAALGCLDLVISSILLATGQAYEANPLFRVVLAELGPPGFVLLKVGMLAGPLALAELARSRSERLVRMLLRVCLVAYTAILIVAFCHWASAAMDGGHATSDTWGL